MTRIAPSRPARASSRFRYLRCHWSLLVRVIAPAHRDDDAAVRVRLRLVRPSAPGPTAQRWARSLPASLPRYSPTMPSTAASCLLGRSRVRTRALAGGATTNEAVIERMIGSYLAAATTTPGRAHRALGCRSSPRSAEQQPAVTHLIDLGRGLPQLQHDIADGVEPPLLDNARADSARLGGADAPFTPLLPPRRGPRARPGRRPGRPRQLRAVRGDHADAGGRPGGGPGGRARGRRPLAAPCSTTRRPSPAWSRPPTWCWPPTPPSCPRRCCAGCGGCSGSAGRWRAG